MKNEKIQKRSFKSVDYSFGLKFYEFYVKNLWFGELNDDSVLNFIKLSLLVVFKNCFLKNSKNKINFLNDNLVIG